MSSRHRVFRLASAALLLPGVSFIVVSASSSPRDRNQVQAPRDGGRDVLRRSLQTCTAADGFTVTSEVFPLMSGCYAVEEVLPNGGGSRLEVMRYRSSDKMASFNVVDYNPYFGYKWSASYYKDGVIGGDIAYACKTNEAIGDFTPAESSFTWECDVDDDDTYEIPTATDAMLSISCGCDSTSGSGETEPSPSPVSITPITTATPVTPVTTTTPAPVTPSRTVTLAPVVPATGTTTSPVTPVRTTTSAPTSEATISGSVAQPAGPVSDSVCSNGLTGIEADEVCCVLSCGLCGGVGCGSVPDHTSDQCCTSDIEDTGDLCSVTGAAPCRVDPPAVNPSTCPNGFAGVADGDACCAEACGVCGGLNCGTTPFTNGATDCCSGVILASGMFCDDTLAAPCIMASESGYGSQSTFSMAPTPAGHTAAPTAADGSRGGFFGSVAPTGAPTFSELGATFSPTGASATLSPGSSPTTDAPVLVGERGETSGAGVVSPITSGGVVGRLATLAAMAGGVLVVLAASRS